MKNNQESMPNQALEPQKPEFSDEDIDRLTDSFKEGRSEEEKELSSKSIENMIAETLTDIEEKEKSHKVERTGIIYTEAAKAAESVLKDNLAMALQMADSPDAAIMLLTPVQERLQNTLDPAGGFSKLHEDPKIQQLYKVFTDKIRHEAVSALKASLEQRIDKSENLAEISNLHKLLVSIEKNDPGGDKE